MDNPKKIMVDDVAYVREDIVCNKKTGNEVIVRTYSAGVHIGTIKEKNGQEIILTNARRLWKWAGAFTLNKVATSGIDRDNSRISISVPEISLIWIEIIPVCEGVDLSTTEG